MSGSEPLSLNNEYGTINLSTTEGTMGRRALRKVSPLLDLSQHLIEQEQLPSFTEMLARLEPAGPLEVEVGCGKGLFLENASGGSAEHRFLGIEITRKYARFAGARLARTGRTNAAMIHGDAQPLVAEWLPDDSVQAFHVYFPDPWWKKRHHKRRLMNQVFVRNIQRVLTPDGVLHFWTDVKDYFDMAVATLHEETSLVGPQPVEPHPASHDLDYRTHFERRTRLHDLPVYRSEFHQPPQ